MNANCDWISKRRIKRDWGRNVSTNDTTSRTVVALDGADRVRRGSGNVVANRVSGWCGAWEIPSESWTARRLLRAVLRMACRVVGLGRRRGVGKLRGGAAITALLTAMGGVTGGMLTTTESVAAGLPAFLSDNTAAAAPPNAAGANSSAGGFGASATGVGSTVIGSNAKDNGNGGAVAIGINAAVTNASAVAVGNTANAAGFHSVALGSNSAAQGSEGVAIGFLAVSGTGNQSVAVGSHASALGDQSTALGNNVSASGNSAVAIGGDDLDKVTQAHGALYTALTGGALAVGTYIPTQSNDGSTAIGVQGTANGFFATAIGLKASAGGAGSLALGTATIASGQGSSALGLAASSTGLNSLAAGTNSNAAAAYATALGSGGVSVATATQATMAGALALGGNASAGAKATGVNAIALGGQSLATNAGDVAIGVGAISTGAVGTGSAVSIGVRSTAFGAGSVAIGDPSYASGQGAFVGGFGNIANGDGTATATIVNQANGAVAIGNTDTAVGQGSVALGNTSRVLAPGGIALGDTATATLANGVALGSNSVAVNVGDVALGANSTTALAIGTSGATIAGTPYTFAGIAPASTVSVGAPGAERTVTNVAAGRLGATSTDAINGSQLFATNTAVNTLNVGGAGPVQYANALTPTTPNGGIPTQNLTLAGGTAGAVTIDNLAAGSLAVGSTQAVNGGQINTLGASLATDLGGGATFNPATGTVLSPAYMIAGNTYTTVGSALDALTGGSTMAGVKYFHANSALPDSTATVADSVAIGPATTAYNSGDFAAGINAVAGVNGGGATNDTAVGVRATATGGNSLAIGSGATATGTANSTAIGSGANAAGNLGLAIGSSANAGAFVSGIAIGSNAVVGGNGSTAIGGNTVSSGVKSIALGDTSRALGNGALAIGRNSVSNVAGDVAIGRFATSTGVAGVGSAVSLGASNTAVGAGAVAIGNTSNAIGQSSIALGNTSQALVAGGIALGDTAQTTLANGVALGSHSIASNANDVALGANATTAAPNTGTTALYGGTAAGIAAAPSGVVSVGVAGAERQIQNVAAGTISGASTDAINGSQLFSVATGVNNLGATVAADLGGGSVFNPASGTVTAPTYTVAGGTQTNVGAALGALDTATQMQGAGLAMALGGGAAVAPNGTVTAPAYTLNGTTYVTVGAALGGIANGAVGTVEYSNAATPTTPNGGIASQNLTLVGAGAGPVTLANVAPGVLTVGSTQAVNGGQVATLGASVAANLGGGSVLDPATGLVTAPIYTVAGTAYTNVGGAIGALTGGSTTAGVKYLHVNSTGPDSTAIGVDSVAIGSNAVSTNVGDVALGAGATTAASVATPGGTIAGIAYTFAGVAPGSTVSVGAPGAERTITNVAAGRLSTTSTDAVNGSELFATNTAVGLLASGGTGPVQYANAATPTTPNGGVASQNLTLVGAGAGPVTLANIAPGALTVGSTQAVNGGQVNIVGTAVATDLGGGSVFDPATGTVTAPTYAVGGGTYANVGAALTALQTGTPLQYSTAAAPTSANGLNASNDVTLVGSNAGAPVALHNVAAGALTATSTDAVNGSQLYATNNTVAALTNGTTGLVQQTGGSPGNGTITIGSATGGSTLDIAGTSGNRVLTAVKAGAANATSSDAINGSQLYATSASVAAALGGGSGVSATGTVTAPTYMVQGGTYTNVGGAIGAIDGDLTTLTTAINGGGVKDFHANSPTGPDSQAVGTNSVAIGSGAIAKNAGDVALGAGSTTAVAVATTGATINGTAYTFAGSTPTSTISVGMAGAERTVTNVAAGQLTATSTDAVNGSELFATNQAVNAAGTSAAQLGATTAGALGGGATYDPTTGKLASPTYTVGAVAYNDLGGAVGALQSAAPLQYSTAATPTTPNGYVPSQDVTFVGAANGPVVLHNVGAGVSSTDAANVGQLSGAFTAPQSNTFAFAQSGSGGAPVTLTNVAAGAVSATSTQAVNGSQLYGLAQGTSNAINNLAQAYNGLQNQVAANDRRASAGAAIALAATGLRYDDRPGKVSLGAGASVFRGQVGFAAGIGHTSQDGAWRYNASISFAPTEAKADVGAVVGASYSFN